LFSRLNQLNKINIHHTYTASPGFKTLTPFKRLTGRYSLFTLLMLMAGLNYGAAHAESGAVSNVLGDEIIIHDEPLTTATPKSEAEAPVLTQTAPPAKTPNKKLALRILQLPILQPTTVRHPTSVRLPTTARHPITAAHWHQITVATKWLPQNQSPICGLTTLLQCSQSIKLL